MLSKTKLTKLFREPSKYANDIIEDQLERMEKQFNYHLQSADDENALAIYQEYKEWIDAEEGDTYGFILLERLESC